MHAPASSSAWRAARAALARPRRIAATLVAAAIGLASAPASAADVVTEARPVGPFRTVRLIGAVDLVLTQADTPTLTAEADAEAMTAMKSEMRGDELVLRYEPPQRMVWWGADRKGPRFLLSAKTLDRISTTGSGDVRAESFTVPGDFEISIAGSSDIRFGSLAARKLLVRISGSGDVTLAGGVLEQNVRIAGSGDYHGDRLQSATATVSIGGSGDATLWARDDLSVRIAGSGDVKYYGRPHLTKSIAGSGSVAALGEKP